MEILIIILVIVAIIQFFIILWYSNKINTHDLFMVITDSQKDELIKFGYINKIQILKNEHNSTFNIINTKTYSECMIKINKLNKLK